MKQSNILHATSLLAILFLLLLTTSTRGLRPYHFSSHSKETSHKGDKSVAHTKEGELGMELYPTGSSLPDCSYACGSCAPCRRVIISFYMKCAVESCPVVYRCMCKGKYYHVPSN